MLFALEAIASSQARGCW